MFRNSKGGHLKCFCMILYETQPKSQGMKQLMAGGGMAALGLALVPLLKGLFG